MCCALGLVLDRHFGMARFSDKPMWGPIFGSMENYHEVAVRKGIKDLSDDLASLQQKES